MPLRLALYIAWAGGVFLFVGLIAYYGFHDMTAAVASAGWGLVWITGFHTLPVIIDALGWRVLLPQSHRRSTAELTWMRWIGESINTLLPVAQVGGDLVRAQLLHRAGVPGALASAAVIADMTTGMLTLILFALLGVVLLVSEGGGAQAVTQLSIGITIFGAIAVGFLLAQRAGVFLGLARLVERIAKDREWRTLTGGAAALDRMMARVYQRRSAVLIACGWRLLGWVLGAGEVWLALYYLGHPVSLNEALVLESLGQALRAAAFAIPGALGVQETGFVVLGGMLGLTAETALALSLIKRVRELVLGLPGLIAWQIIEGRRAWRQRMSES